jgi:signal transduction histidine kinase
MPDGGLLTIRSRLDDGEVVVDISDTGMGIPAEIRDKIFDPFFTTKSDGTGLGLSIVYNIMAIHNGEVAFNSNGEGTTFTLKLPVNV